MPCRTPRILFSLLFLMLAPFSAGRTEAAGSAPWSASFSGTWGLNDDLSEDPFEKWMKEGRVGASGGRGGGRGGRGGEAPSDAPPAIVMEGDRRLVVVDDGATVRVSRGPGRERVLFPDGREVAVDDADGPATLTARRKGTEGERIVVSIAWSNGRSLSETWELLKNPRRLTVRTKISGRRSFSYRRVYEPLPDAPPESLAVVPPPVPTVLPASAAAGAARSAASTPAPGPPVIPPGPAVRPECSIRPPRRTPPSELSRMAKVSADDAASRARAAVAPARPESVVSSEVEVIDGCLVWSFFLRFADRKGVQEVVIDAGDGKVLSSTHEE